MPASAPARRRKAAARPTDRVPALSTHKAAHPRQMTFGRRAPATGALAPRRRGIARQTAHSPRRRRSAAGTPHMPTEEEGRRTCRRPEARPTQSLDHPNPSRSRHSPRQLLAAWTQALRAHIRPMIQRVRDLGHVADPSLRRVHSTVLQGRSDSARADSNGRALGTSQRQLASVDQAIDIDQPQLIIWLAPGRKANTYQPRTRPPPRGKWNSEDVLETR